MAFLRSVTRCNSLVTRNIPSTGCNLSHSFSSTSNTVRGSDFYGKPSRSVLLSSHHRYYVNTRRELNTNRSAPISSSDPNDGRQMSTVAATSPAAKIQPATKTATSNDPSPSSPQRDPLDTGFNDPIAAFKSKTTWELVRAYVVYLMCSSEYLVENNMKVKNNNGKVINVFLCKKRQHLPGCNSFFSFFFININRLYCM